MKKRFWFIVLDYNSKDKQGRQNLGFVSDENNPLNNNLIKKYVLKNNPDWNDISIVITNIYEFSSEQDYVDFWTVSQAE